jgi:hypothetical protein
MMKQSTVHTYARSLYDQMGPRSEAYVAQKITKQQHSPSEEDGINWPRIRSALMIIKSSRGHICA